MAALEAEGLDRVGAEMLARNFPAAEISFTLEHVWPILKPGALNPAGRLTMAVRRRTTPEAARKMASGRSAEALAEDRPQWARPDPRRTTPAAESTVLRSVERSAPRLIECKCGAPADLVGLNASCRAECGPLRLTIWDGEVAWPNGEGEPIAVAVIAEAVPS